MDTSLPVKEGSKSISLDDIWAAIFSSKRRSDSPSAFWDGLPDRLDMTSYWRLGWIDLALWRWCLQMREISPFMFERMGRVSWYCGLTDVNEGIYPKSEISPMSGKMFNSVTVIMSLRHWLTDCYLSMTYQYRYIPSEIFVSSCSKLSSIDLELRKTWSIVAPRAISVWVSKVLFDGGEPGFEMFFSGLTTKESSCRF